MEKKYIGRSRSLETKYGKMHKVGISRSDFDKYAKNDWLNVLIKFSKEGNAYLELDEYQPKKGESDSWNKNPNDVPF